MPAERVVELERQLKETKAQLEWMAHQSRCYSWMTVILFRGIIEAIANPEEEWQKMLQTAWLSAKLHFREQLFGDEELPFGDTSAE